MQRRDQDPDHLRNWPTVDRTTNREGRRKTRETYRQQARLRKALANESRLPVIDRLAESEASAGGLDGLVGTDTTTARSEDAVGPQENPGRDEHPSTRNWGPTPI